MQKKKNLAAIRERKIQRWVKNEKLLLFFFNVTRSSHTKLSMKKKLQILSSRTLLVVIECCRYPKFLHSLLKFEKVQFIGKNPPKINLNQVITVLLITKFCSISNIYYYLKINTWTIFLNFFSIPLCFDILYISFY